MGFAITTTDLDNLNKVLQDRPELSLTKIAQAIDIDRSTLSRINSGKTKNMSDQSYQRLKNFLDTYLSGTDEEINELQNLILYGDKQYNHSDAIKASLIKANDLITLELFSTMQTTIDLQQEVKIELEKVIKEKDKEIKQLNAKLKKVFKIVSEI